MSRYSDVWIVLALAAVAGWRHWECIEPELAAAAGFVMQESPPAELAESDTLEAPVFDVEFRAAPELSAPPLDTYWPTCPAPFDCSQAPAGSYIIYDAYAPVCGMPMTCWGY